MKGVGGDFTKQDVGRQVLRKVTTISLEMGCSRTQAFGSRGCNFAFLRRWLAIGALFYFCNVFCRTRRVTCHSGVFSVSITELVPYNCNTATRTGGCVVIAAYRMANVSLARSGKENNAHTRAPFLAR